MGGKRAREEACALSDANKAAEQSVCVCVCVCVCACVCVRVRVCVCVCVCDDARGRKLPSQSLRTSSSPPFTVPSALSQDSSRAAALRGRALSQGMAREGLREGERERGAKSVSFFLASCHLLAQNVGNPPFPSNFSVFPEPMRTETTRDEAK